MTSLRGRNDMKGKFSTSVVRSAAVILSIGVASSTTGAEDIRKSTSAQFDASHFTYTRLYCTPDNESHFGELTVNLASQNFAPPASPLHIGGNQQASTLFFGGFEAHWGAADLTNHLYHPTPAVQSFTVAEGVFSITTTDGEMRQLRAGAVVQLEDVAPCKGHITVVGETTGFLLFAR
jgi:hypothetical protein